ncbi:MAG TPA: transcription initiation factor IIB [Candidatus Bathyarchaeota archaeon]|nr:transcription initiation factor IIB [Candidatus Bathyarchaeota archaeon]
MEGLSFPEPNRCPYCGSPHLLRDTERAEIVCRDCGRVIEMNLMDLGPEWRAFEADERTDRVRVGAPITRTIHDKGLTTSISWLDKDLASASISPDRRAQIQRMRKWQRRIRIYDAKERNLAHALSEMKRVADKLGIPKSVIETAACIYRRAVMDGLVRGRSIQSMAAATLYIACRICGHVRTLDEIADAASLEKKEVGRSFRFLVSEMKLHVPPLTPRDYVARLLSRLRMRGEAEDIAYKTLAIASELRLTSGRGPMGVAAAAVYVASVLTGERKTQREIAELARVTEVTIRNRYKSLVKNIVFEVML